MRKKNEDKLALKFYIVARSDVTVIWENFVEKQKRNIIENMYVLREASFQACNPEINGFT